MKLELKDFQSEAVVRLVSQLRRASQEATLAEQAVVLSSPTGSGKTVMVTAAIESLLEGDAQHAPDEEATFLWVSDQPELNAQTQRKILETSSLLDASRLVLIGPSFDQEVLSPGRVYFLNTQKLGRDKQLVTPGDARAFTIWQTIENTRRTRGRHFFVFVDEAHRGMTASAKDVKEATTIAQKFVKGSPGELSPVPIIVGISATPQRFDTLVQQTSRTLRPVAISPDAVRSSGLLKDVIRLYHPKGQQPSDMTMLRDAAASLRKYSTHWRVYCQAQDEPPVRPVLVVQVQDGSGKQLSATDIGEAIDVINEAIGPLPPTAFAHAFQEGGPLDVGSHRLRYVAPSDITADPDIEVVFFKTSLNTGWDCPRAEVMMSFRKAVDSTLIAQLVGRMVRTPLARRIGADEFLNIVALYLPYYDAAALERVLKHLKSPDPDILPPVDVEDGDSAATATRAKDTGSMFEHLAQLPSYVIPRARRVPGAKRLMKLARLLANDGIDEEAVETAESTLLGVLKAEYETAKATLEFKAIVDERGKVRLNAKNWQVGGEASDGDTVVLDIAKENLDDIFDASGRRLGEGLHKLWWRMRVETDDDERLRAKLEAVALAASPGTLAKLEKVAQDKTQAWLEEHRGAINALPDGRLAGYDEVRQLAADPELSPLVYPETIEVRDSAQHWERHLYVDVKNTFPAKLNTWETKVLQAALKDSNVVGWLRNLDRKSWSLTVPYQAGNEPRALYPDFLIVRRTTRGQLEVDLLDPHLPDLADAPQKAAGLARYAAKHGHKFGKIEIIIVEGDEIRRLDLAKEAVREKVTLVTTSEQLLALFSSGGS